MSTALEFWKRAFGDAYTKRQTLNLRARAAMFSRIFWGDTNRRAIDPKTLIEFGANIGDNLRAIRTFAPGVAMSGVEPNVAAYKQMEQIPGVTGYLANIHQFGKYNGIRRYDLAFTRGVLIHIPPDDLREAYQVIYGAAKRWILLAEYYSPKPLEVEYRGQWGRLWKRDFAGEMMTAYPDLKLIDYGFVYHRDPVHPQDDVTWMLLEKTQ